MARCPSLGLTHLEDLGATYCFELNGDPSSCATAYFTRLGRPSAVLSETDSERELLRV